MKTRIKTIFFSALSVITTFIAVIYVSCSKDKCRSAVCNNGGVCSGGKCTCQSGYEGVTCQTISRQKFMGNWAANQSSSIPEAAQYPVSIEAGHLVTDISIRNFDNNYFAAPVNGVVEGNKFTIPVQEISGKMVVGAGYIYFTAPNDNAISVSYQVTDMATNATQYVSEVWH